MIALRVLRVLVPLLVLGGVLTAQAANNRTFLPQIDAPLRFVAGLPINPSATHTGEGTYYTEADGRGNCAFAATPGNLNVAALNAPDYTPGGSNALWCGAYVRVTGPNGSVTVRIVDKCPECRSGDLDLSPSAFAQIAPISAGRVPISWKLLSPVLNGPIQYHIKDGSNPYWVGVQIRNHRNPIWKVELRQSSGSYTNLPRQDYNYFIAQSNTGFSSLALRVTDIYGNVLSDSGIGIVAESTTNGAAQLPAAQP